MPTSAMKACFQIAECSFSVAKIGKEYNLAKGFSLYRRGKIPTST